MSKFKKHNKNKKFCNNIGVSKACQTDNEAPI